jgi:hypothetical protein
MSPVDAMVSMGAEVDKPAVLQILSMYYENSEVGSDQK